MSIRESIEARRFLPGMKRALVLVLEGQSYREAAKAERQDWRDLFKNAGTVPGLRDAHLEAWRERWGNRMPGLWLHHLRRLDDAA